MRPLVGGLLVGLAVVVALDVPPATTRIGVQMAASSEPAERERGLALLRAAGDDDLLLRLCYGMAGRPTGLLSAFVMVTSYFDTQANEMRTIAPREVAVKVTPAVPTFEAVMEVWPVSAVFSGTM